MYRMLQVMYAYKVKQLIIADNAVCTQDIYKQKHYIWKFIGEILLSGLM